MSPFYLTLLAAFVAGFGARDQVTVAALSARQRGHWPLLLLAAVSSVATAVFAGWASAWFLDVLAAPARLFMASMALLLAGLECIVIRPRARMEEPTQSLGAATLVIVASQLTDAARFLVFGTAIATAQPVPAVIGGAVAGLLLIGMAWAGSELIVSERTRAIRRVAGAVLLVVAVFVGLRAANLV